MYKVIFDDAAHGEVTEQFDSFDEAAEFWQNYADTETCEAGELIDRTTGEIIWSFGEE